MSSLPTIALIPVLLCTLVPSRAETTRQPLDFHEVEVGGELQTRLERNFGRLHARRYSEPVLFTETADPNWPGDYEGRTGLALVLGAQALRIDAPGIDSLMAAFPQHYNEQGYFGPVHLPGAVDEQQLSSHGWTLRALCEYYNWHKKPETKAQINRIVENLVLPTKGLHEKYPLDPGARKGQGEASGNTIAQVGKWRLSTDVGCDFIFFDGVVQAYAVTRDERLVPVIEEIADLFNRMDILGIKAQTHATLSGTRAMIRWYELCGKPEVLAKAEKVFETYLREGCTENFENYNWFGRPEWTEPCAIIDSFLVACQLWQHTGKPAHLEAAQQIYFNGICATQRSNGGWGLNNCSGSSHAFLCSTCPEAYWCCSMRGAEGLAAAARYSAFKDDVGLWLATFMDGSLTIPFAGGPLKLRQESRYPPGESTKLTIETAPPEPLELRFFLPSYLENASIRVNGEQVEHVQRDGFAVIRRAWAKNDVVEFIFKASIRREPTRNLHSLERHDLIRRGPLLMAATPDEQPSDKDQPPAAITVEGDLAPDGPGGVRVGETRLRPVHHLLDPSYDDLVPSWRQVLFPSD